MLQVSSVRHGWSCGTDFVASHASTHLHYTSCRGDELTACDTALDSKARDAGGKAPRPKYCSAVASLSTNSNASTATSQRQLENRTSTSGRCNDRRRRV